MQKKILFSFLFFLIFTPSFCKEIRGKPIIIDGDTIKIANERIRLYGIDAPEINQECQKPFLSIGFFTFNKKYSCGEISKKILKKFIKTQIVKCIFESRDRYNRPIAECFTNKKNINSWMVKKGYAVAYKKYSKKYINEEAYAKENKLGLWQGPFIRPEKWRKKNKYKR